MEAVDTVLVEELELRFEIQVFQVTSMIHGFEVTLQDRYLNPVLLMVIRGHLRFLSILVKRLVGQEHPIDRVGVWISTCL